MYQNENKIPFDPGFYKLKTSFPNDAHLYIDNISKLKSKHQINFKLVSFETSILKSIKQFASICLGCVLWGGFIHCRYKNNPKEIIGNPAFELAEEDLEKLDHTYEADYILELVENLDKQCRYHLKRPLKSGSEAINILNVYKKFILINNNFINTLSTADVKLPEELNHFYNIEEAELEKLKNLIFEIIESGQAEDILKIGFYKTYANA